MVTPWLTLFFPPELNGLQMTENWPLHLAHQKQKHLNPDILVIPRKFLISRYPEITYSYIESWNQQIPNTNNQIEIFTGRDHQWLSPTPLLRRLPEKCFPNTQ